MRKNIQTSLLSRRPSRRLSILALVVLLVIAVTVGLILAAPQEKPSAKGNPSGKPADNALPVIVSRVMPTEDDIALDLVGSGLASKSVTVFPMVAGEVERVAFAAGDRVKKGQELVRLISRSERLAVELAETQVDAAERLLKRYQRTRGSGAVSPTVVDEARNAFQRAKIELALARERLRDRSVHAPFSGVVGIAQVDPGDRVNVDTPLTTLDDRSTLSVDFDVPESYFPRLRAGQSVLLTNVGLPGREFPATLSHIDSRVDPATRTVNARAEVDNSKDLLRPGMSFSVKLTLPGRPVIRVPELAVQWSRDGSHVWAVREGKSVRVPVRLARRMEGSVLVDGDLYPSDVVVIEGVQRLRPGRQVHVVRDRIPPDGATVRAGTS